jgi:hypothetical protein
MATMRTLLLLAVGVMQTAAMYTARSPVVTLDPSNFQEKVKSSEGVFLVEFYAPWWVPSIRTLPDSPLTNPHRRCPPPGGGAVLRIHDHRQQCHVTVRTWPRMQSGA